MRNFHDPWEHLLEGSAFSVSDDGECKSRGFFSGAAITNIKCSFKDARDRELEGRNVGNISIRRK